MANRKISAAGSLVTTAADTDQMEIERETGLSAHMSFATLIDYIKTSLKWGTANGTATLDIAGTLSGAQIPASLKVQWVRYASMGVPANDATIYGFVPGTAFVLPTNLEGSRICCRLPPTGLVSFKLMVNGSQVGTATIPGGATSASIATTGAVSLLAEDRFTVVSPVSVDPAIRDIFFAISGIVA